jgi:hypothetical protein
MKAFQRYHRRTSPVHRRLRIFMLLVFAGISLESAIGLEAGTMGYRVLYFFVMLGIYLLVVSLLIFVLNQITQFRTFREGQSGVLCEHTITLTPEALLERTAVNNSKALWRGIFRVDATPEYIFIFTQPGAAHTIPRRFFATPSDSEQFLAAARTYHETARRNA